MRQDRMFWTCFAALLGVLLTGWVKPDSLDPLDNVRSEEIEFFIHKTHGVSGAPGIILGDSRALRGLDPDRVAMAAGLPGLFNFSFESGGMNDEMYAAVEQRLAPDGHRAVFLAITPLAFMPWKVGNDQYHEYLDAPRDQRVLYRRLPAVAEFFEPRTPSALVRLLTRRPPKVRVDQEFHANGWIETDQRPSTVALETDRAVERLDGNHADPGLMDAFMARTREWVASDIRVYGVRPPSTPRMRAIEDSTLGFDHGDFVARFTAAGGIWIESNEAAYETYDGSHLKADDAARYSRQVGEAIATAPGPGSVVTAGGH